MEESEEEVGELSNTQHLAGGKSSIPPVPKLYGKSRKKRQFGQFQKDQMSAVSEQSDVSSAHEFHTPQTIRNSSKK